MFIRDHFQFNRGIPNCQASGEGLTTVQHTYASNTDSVADISSLDYFPDNFNEDASFVIPKDTILIIGSDAVIMVEVLTTAPVTIGSNLLTGGGASLEVDPPIAATDANGLVINGNILTLEFADASNPGILSDTTQSIGGTKSFPDDVHTNKVDTITAVPLELGTTTASSVTVNKNNSTSLVSGITIESTVNVPANVGLQYRANGLNIINGTSELTLDAFGNFSCPPIFFVNEIQHLSPPGTLLINAPVGGITSLSTFIFDRTAGIQFPAGSGSGQIRKFQNTENIPLTASGPWADPKSCFGNIYAINDTITIVISGVEPFLATVSVQPINIFGLPGYAFPPGAAEIKGLVFVTDNSASAIGVYVLDSQLNVWSNFLEQGFSSGGAAGFQTFTITYNLTNP